MSQDSDIPPFVAFGPEDLKHAIGKTIVCPHCGSEHPVQYGESVFPDGTKRPSNLLGFYKCGDKAYLCAVDGKAIKPEYAPKPADPEPETDEFVVKGAVTDFDREHMRESHRLFPDEALEDHAQLRISVKELAHDNKRLRGDRKILRRLLQLARKYVEDAALMHEDIIRHAPLPPEAQAKHDASENVAHTLLESIDKELKNV